MQTTTFDLRRSQTIDTLSVRMDEFVHGDTGARHYHLACDDPNNAFMVVFPTLPEDSTGVAHILEHTTLCGSRTYPVRDPFFMMLRRSLNTFMNAFTSTDNTAYPFATRSRTDFDNLLAVYLDAVFFPNLHPLDFAQEGYRVELKDRENPDAGLAFKGVVFNEMKGAMSSPIAQVWQHLHAALFPDTTYRFNSGGDPIAIPDLTHAGLRAFHAKHYHPSRAVFMTYGSFPASEHQEKFSRLVLTQPSGRLDPIVPTTQTALGEAVHVEHVFAVDAAEELQRNTHMVWAWVLGESAVPRHMLDAHLLAGILLEHSASPLRHLLETTPYAEAPSELCGIDDSARQIVFCCGVEGSDPQHAEALERAIMELLAKVARDGVAQDTLDAVLDKMEMAQRDISGDGFPYGLQLMMRIASGALYNRDPFALLDIDHLLTELREAAREPGYVPGLLGKFLLENTHRCRVSMAPDLEKRQRDHAVEQARLDALARSYTAADFERIRESTAALEQRQAVEDDAGVLPRVTLADVPPFVAVEHPTIVDCGLPVHPYPRGTNGIVHAQLSYDLPPLTEEVLGSLTLFSQYLLEVGNGGESYLDVQTRRARLGHFAAHTTVRSRVNDLDRACGYLVISAKGLRRRMNVIVDELFDVLGGACFDDQARLRDLLAQSRAEAEVSITDRGHHLAIHGAARGLSRSAWLNDQWGGPSAIINLKRLEETAKTDTDTLPRFAATLAELREHLATGATRLLMVGEDEVLHQACAHISGHRPSTSRENGADLALPQAGDHKDTAWLTTTEVNFNAMAYPAVADAHPDAPALHVLGRYLTEGYLHPEIRERGGAYGAGVSYDGDAGCLSFYSYRDPRLAETLAVFGGALEWFKNHLDAQRLEEAILGVIRSVDRSRSPAGEVIHAFHSERQGRTNDFRRRFRAAVVAMDLDTLHDVAERYLASRKIGVGVVTSSSRSEEIERLGLIPVAL